MRQYITTYGGDGYFELGSLKIDSGTVFKFKAIPRIAPQGFWLGNWSYWYGIYHPVQTGSENVLKWYSSGVREGIFYSGSTSGDILDHSFEIEVATTYVKVNGTTINKDAPINDTFSSFHVGNSTNAGQFDAKKPVEWEYFQIYQDGVLTLDLVPAINNNVYCFKDKVSNTYLYATGNVDGEVSSFEVSPSSLTFTYSGDTTSLAVNTDNDTSITWSASTENAWLSLSPTTGAGDGSVSVVCTENKGSNNRTGTITFTSSEGDVMEVSVEQSTRPLVSHPIYREGNKVKRAYREGRLIFHYLTAAKPIATALTLNVADEIASTGKATVSFAPDNAEVNITWASSDTDIATIDSGGNITVVADGQTTITATDSRSHLTASKQVSCVLKPDYSAMPLTFEILSGGTIVWKRNGSVDDKTIQYSKNDEEWTSITSSADGVAIPVNVGDIIKFKGTNNAYAIGDFAFVEFGASTAIYSAYGNVMSLIGGDDFEDLTTLTEGYALCSLFRNGATIVDASNLILPATALTTWCYKSMFENCTSLAAAPSILPATTLAVRCYYGMFYGCRSLTVSPTLPATTLVDNCYQQMFQNCTSLNSITCLATNISAHGNLGTWVSGVSSTGTFTKAAGVIWPTGTSGIPDGWTVVDAE